MTVDGCEACFANYHWLGFHEHHLIPRSRCRGRKGWDSKPNKVRLCARCHDCVHSHHEPGFETLTMAMLLWVRLEVPSLWDKELLERLNAPRALPYPEPLPVCFHQERLRNLGFVRAC